MNRISGSKGSWNQERRHGEFGSKTSTKRRPGAEIQKPHTQFHVYARFCLHLMCILSLIAIGGPILHPPLPLLILLASRQPRRIVVDRGSRSDRSSYRNITPRCAGFRRCMSLSSADVTVKRTVTALLRQYATLTLTVDLDSPMRARIKTHTHTHTHTQTEVQRSVGRSKDRVETNGRGQTDRQTYAGYATQIALSSRLTRRSVGKEPVRCGCMVRKP